MRTLLLLPFSLILVAYWAIYLLSRLIGSFVGTGAGMLLVSLAFLPSATIEEKESVIVFGFAILLASVLIKKKPMPPPPAFFKPRPRPQRPAKPRVVPTVSGMTKTQSAPSAQEALGRLSPRLRQIIEKPPRSAGEEPGAA